MGFTRFTKNVLNVSALPDRVQNQASALKLVFDQSGVDIKAALNGLIAELEDSASAGSIGASVESVTTNTIQAILTAFDEYIADRYTKNETDTLISANTNTLISDVDINLTTGVITITKKDGTVETFDTAIEKVPAKFEIIESGSSFFLRITNVDGTYTQTDITKLMNIYKFNNSEDIAFEVNGTGNEKTVTASIRANSIGLDKLSLSAVSTIEGYVASAKDSASAAKISETNAKSSEIIAQNAATSAEQNAQIASEAVSASNIATEKAIEARSYARGGTGTRAGEDKDNAKYYCERAKEVAGGDIVLNSEFEEAMANVPNYTELALTGEIIETDTSLALESVLSISGNSEQETRSGKNLLKKNKSVYTDKTRFGITFTVNDDESVTINGTNDGTGNSELFLWNNASEPITLPAGTYNTKNTGDSNVRIVGKTPSGYMRLADESKTSFTLDEDAIFERVYIQVSTGATTAFTNFILYPIITKSTDSVEPYEPYGAMPSPDYPSEIRSVSGDVEARVEGKNLFNFDDILRNHQVSLEGSPDNFTLSTKTETGYSTVYWNLGLIDCDTIYYSFNTDVSSDSIGRFAVSDELGGTRTMLIEFASSTTIGSIDVSSYRGKYLSIMFRGNSTGYTSQTISNVIVSKTEITNYIPYVEPKTVSIPLGDIELRSTPDGTRDTFQRVDGVWNVLSNVGSEVFDGVNVRFDKKSTSTANTIWMSPAEYEVENKAAVMCDRFNGNSDSLYARDGIGIYAENKRLKVAFGLNSELTTLELANNWLVNNPLYVIYPTTTPTYTPITDSALITVLDELESLVLHKGYNRITATSVNGVKAYLDLNIPATAFITNVETTESSLDMPVLIASREGDVKAKISENGITLNPATGVVKVKDIQVNGKKVATEEYVNNIISSAITTVLEASY